MASQCLPYSDSSMFTHAINLNLMLKLLAIQNGPTGLSVLAWGCSGSYDYCRSCHLASQCLPKRVFYIVGILRSRLMASQCLPYSKTLNYHYQQCPMRLSMWWDGVWAGRRLDSGVCPIYKHTELDDTGVVNDVKVLPKRFAKAILQILKLYELTNYCVDFVFLHAFSDIREHIMLMKDMACKLKGLDMDISDGFLVHFTITSLPTSYEAFKIIYNTEKYKLMKNELIAIKNNTNKDAFKAPKSHASAFSSSNNSNGKPYCKFCRKVRHKPKNCPDFKE
ncbi:hypothetical protein E3N88_28596 [Mikania micrantha]|uniref:Uncharacterized protein n=1 Tax=Mikania micrantha TaxID=192012 RepID=A0A5N6N2R1_9ASTR|nr:hypothetical protein E3N88_28596 [Mikania micrantha]